MSTASAVRVLDDVSARPLSEKLADLRVRLRALSKLIVGFSGGIDSTFLLKVAVEELGENTVALTAVSASLPEVELRETRRLAEAFGVRHETVRSDEIHNPSYARNPTNRCYYCKVELFRIADDLKQRFGIEHVAIGTNLDDLSGHRPGLEAAEQHGVLHPLVEAGFTKADIREAGRELGVDIWDKPSFACLASRFPYGTHITEGRLNKVEACEDVLRQLGFRVFRVRYHNDLVRIEVGEAELGRFINPAVRQAVSEGCRAVGFKFVSLDLEPHRTGRMNE